MVVGGSPHRLPAPATHRPSRVVRRQRESVETHIQRRPKNERLRVPMAGDARDMLARGGNPGSSRPRKNRGGKCNGGRPQGVPGRRGIYGSTPLLFGIETTAVLWPAAGKEGESGTGGSLRRRTVSW